MKLAFEEHGNGSPVILIHAFPLSRRMWRPQIEPLAAAGYRVILPDLFGFGESRADKNARSLEVFATAVSDLLDDLQIEKAIVGGLSMGGYVTFNLYRMFPEKFRAMILADTNSAADTEEKRRSRWETIKKIERAGVGVLVEDMLPKLVSENTKKENPALVKKLAGEFSEVRPEGAINALAAMAERRDHNYILGAIAVPTVLIFGAEDTVTSLENGARMAAAIPGAKLLKIEKAGHFSNLEQPAQFNHALVGFLKSVRFND